MLEVETEECNQKTSLIQTIKARVDEMSLLIKKLRFAYDPLFLPEGWILLPVDQLQLAADWLNDLWINEFRIAREVRSLCDEQVWTRMELRGETDMREVKLLKTAFGKLRMRLTEPARPILFKRKLAVKAINLINRPRKKKETSDV